jgi:hypothetical protein
VRREEKIKERKNRRIVRGDRSPETVSGGKRQKKE